MIRILDIFRIAKHRIAVATLTIALCVMIVGHANAAAQDRWVGDVPVMDGLTIEPELGFAFDSPSGRIVMIFASTTLNETKLFGFYDSALASLGWIGGGGSWARGPEKLTIEQISTSAGMLWRIMLRPN